MATDTDLRDAVYATLVDYVQLVTDVDDAATHVAELESDSAPAYPGVGFELFSTPRPDGIGTAGYVTDTVLDNGDHLTALEIAYRQEARVEVGVFTRDRRKRSTLHDALREHIDPLLDDPSLLHDDVESLSPAGSDGTSRAEEGVTGIRQRYDVEYERRRTKSVTPMRVAELTIEDLERATDLDGVTIDL